MNRKIYDRLQALIKSCPQMMANPQALKTLVNSTFDVEIENTVYSSVLDLSYEVDKLTLECYFGKVWQPVTKKYKYSGLGIVDEINGFDDNLQVLDLGCGYNEFKGKINNLTGVDPYNKRADIKSDIMSYEPENLYDILISFGSINFGSADKIILEMIKATSFVKPGGLMYHRVNPGKMHDKPEAQWIDFFNWTPEFISNLAPVLGVTVITIKQDGERLFFLLRKKT